MALEGKTKVKAMCLFYKNGRILASKGFDKLKNEYFCRLLGGNINFFETSEAGIRREVQEELMSEIENLRFVDTIENLFTYEGKKGHEIVFLYTGDLVRKELYAQNSIHVVDNNGEFDAEWISAADILSGKIALYPNYDYETLLKEL